MLGRSGRCRGNGLAVLFHNSSNNLLSHCSISRSCKELSHRKCICALPTESLTSQAYSHTNMLSIYINDSYPQRGNPKNIFSPSIHEAVHFFLSPFFVGAIIFLLFSHQHDRSVLSIFHNPKNGSRIFPDQTAKQRKHVFAVAPHRQHARLSSVVIADNGKSARIRLVILIMEPLIQPHAG